MKTLASGWCPKHDRVYRSANRCPECGTALIPLEPPFHAEGAAAPPAVAEHAASHGPPAPAGRLRSDWVRRGAMAAALIAAFALGSILPRTETEPTAASQEEKIFREVHLRDQIGRSPDGVTLFLAVVIQRDDTFTAVFSSGPNAPDAGSIEDAAVEVTTSGSGRTFSASSTEVRPRRDGFTVTGTLDSPELIRELRITSLQVREDSAPEWGANISKVWPVGDEEPRVLRLSGGSRPVEGGTIRLSSLVCWRDRIEAVFDLRGEDGTPGNRSEMVGIELRTSTPNASQTLVGRSIAATKTELTSAGQLIARFEAVPDNAGPIIVKATRMMSFVAGPWTWRLA